MYENESPEGLAAVRDDAVKAILGFVKTPAASSGKKHLVDMAAVQQLRGDEEHGRLFELLNVFANRKLIEYVAVCMCAYVCCLLCLCRLVCTTTHSSCVATCLSFA